MDLYICFAWKSFRQRLAYKTNTILGVMRCVLVLFIQISAWKALYGDRVSVDGIALGDMMTYVILGLVLDALTRSFMDRRIAQHVEEGLIANDFVRPVLFKYFIMAEDVGENCFSALFSALPACILGMLCWEFRAPASFPRGVLFAISLGGGVLLIYQLNYVLGLLAFWFEESYFIDWLFGAFRTLLSGALVPLWFYPPMLRGISECFPWHLVYFAPLAIYLEKCTLAVGFRVLLLQGIWFLFLLAAERALWKRAQLKVQVYGG